MGSAHWSSGSADSGRAPCADYHERTIEKGMSVHERILAMMARHLEQFTGFRRTRRLSRTFSVADHGSA